MLGTLLKLFAYSRAPKRTFAVLHPKKTAKTAAVPWDLAHGYGPRVAALVTAAVVGPLAYRVGRRLGADAERERGGEVRIERVT